MKIFTQLVNFFKNSRYKKINESSQVNIEIEELIYSGELDKLKEIINQNGFNNAENQNDNELSILHIACASGNIKIVEYFLDQNLDVNIKRINNFAPIHSAAMLGHTEICKILINKGADINVLTIPQKYAPIHSASFGGHLSTVKLLVENGANFNIKNYRNEYPIDVAKRQGQVHIVEYFENL